MGRGLGIGVGAVVVVGAALVAPWLCGKIFEQRFRAALDEYAQQTPYPLTITRYERHWFDAEVETSLSIPVPDLHPAVAQPTLPTFDASGDPVVPAAPPAAPARPVEFVIRHHVAHGPFSTAAHLARVTSTPVWPAETQAQIARLFKDQPPLTVVTGVGFGGALDGRVQSPAAEAAIVAPELSADAAQAGADPAAGAPAQVKWSGIDGRFHVDGDKAQHSTFAAQAPLLTVEQGADHVTVQAMHVDGDLRRDTATGQFFVGTAGFGIDGLAFTGKPDEVQIDKLATTVALTEHDGLLDELIGVGAEQGRAAGQTVRKPTLRIALTNLDAAALSEWRNQMRQQMHSADGQPATPDPVLMLASLTVLAPKLLVHRPGFALQELSFDDGRGLVKLTGDVRYVGKADAAQLSKITPADFEAAANAEAPLSVVDQMLLLKAGGTDPARAQAKAVAARNDLVKQSMLVIDGERATSVLSFKDGVLTVNGKVLPLTGLMPGAGP